VSAMSLTVCCIPQTTCSYTAATGVRMVRAICDGRPNVIDRPIRTTIAGAMSQERYVALAGAGATSPAVGSGSRSMAPHDHPRACDRVSTHTQAGALEPLRLLVEEPGVLGDTCHVSAVERVGPDVPP